MPAVSSKQRRIMAAARAYKRGTYKGEPSEEIKRLAGSMSDEDLTDFMHKAAGVVPGVPDGTGPRAGTAACVGPRVVALYALRKAGPRRDGTGPHGRGAGPGKGKADGTGMMKQARDWPWTFRPPVAASGSPMQEPKPFRLESLFLDKQNHGALENMRLRLREKLKDRRKPTPQPPDVEPVYHRVQQRIRALTKPPQMVAAIKKQGADPVPVRRVGKVNRIIFSGPNKALIKDQAPYVEPQQGRAPLRKDRGYKGGPARFFKPRGEKPSTPRPVENPELTENVISRINKAVASLRSAQ